MHAVVVHVTIPAGRTAEAERMLRDQVVPNSLQATGFLDGYWLRSDDGTEGISIEIFDSRDAATAFAAAAPDMPTDSPVTIDSVAVHEVIAST